jgi:hypothetical protein
VAAASWFKYTYLSYVSHPRADRQLFRLLKRIRAARLVEIGIGDIDRTLTLIEVAQRYAPAGKVSYCGLDRFDDRASGDRALSLKQAYKSLHATGAQIRLMPGPVATSLSAVANSCPNTDLLLIAAFIGDRDMQGGWFYLPRMLRENSLVFRRMAGEASEPSLRRLTASDLAARADQTSVAASRQFRRRAA